MKTPSILSLILLVGLGGCVYVSCKPVWDFARLESRARKAVTGAEMQMWATNLLGRRTNEGRVLVSEAGADFPKELLSLAPQIGPDITIRASDNTNFPSYVQVSWGSGFLGCKCFMIGPTNFSLPPSSHAWRPGVYFCQW